MRRILQLAAISTLLFSATSALAAGENILSQKEYLYAGQQIVYTCYYRLTMQADGNLVLYERSRALWSSNTAGRGAYAAMQADGNLVVYNWSHQAVWSSGTYGNPGAYLMLQDDRNLVIYTPNGRALWASNTRDDSEVGVAIQPCNWECVKTNGFAGYDLPGGDFYFYYYFPGGDGIYCASLCAALSGCVAYTFVPAGYQDPTYARCWVKSSVPGWELGPSDFFSGKIIRVTHHEGNL